LFILFRFPREGGDPDPFTQTERAFFARVIASAAKQPKGLTRT
jgi:hypothetical protein